jgi:5-hydroxyisourate hydrolase-like protein (transthyretin family)
MAKTSNVIGGIPVPQVDPAQLQNTLSSVEKQAATAGVPALNTFAQLQQRRATRMTNAAKILSAKLGKNDPAVVAAQTMAQSALDLNTHITTQTVRVKNFPRLHPNEWIVYGTVVDGQGKPAVGLSVRVFDKDRKYDDLLGDTETDANGDFSSIYHERDFKETGENFPDLYVMVSDASGKVLFSSLDSVRYEAGRLEYFAIRLGATKAPRATRKKAA